MGLFNDQVKQVEDFIREKQRLGQVQPLQPGPSNWPAESSLVLEEEAALELGNPSLGSLSFLLWSEAPLKKQDRILLVGPDLKDIKEKRIPFCQVILVKGFFRDEYECYRELRDAVFDTRLQGFMVRVLPSRQTIWCRVNRQALTRGFSLTHLGAALINKLKALDFVSAVDVIFVTSGRDDLEKLKPAGYDADRIVGALMKMVEEKSYDCQTCEYLEVCEKIEELKLIRKKMQEEPAK